MKFIHQTSFLFQVVHEYFQGGYLHNLFYNPISIILLLIYSNIGVGLWQMSLLGTLSRQISLCLSIVNATIPISVDNQVMMTASKKNKKQAKNVRHQKTWCNLFRSINPSALIKFNTTPIQLAHTRTHPNDLYSSQHNFLSWRTHRNYISKQKTTESMKPLISTAHVTCTKSALVTYWSDWQHSLSLSLIKIIASKIDKLMNDIQWKWSVTFKGGLPS